MKLWLIYQTVNIQNYDTYDSAVVAAETEEEARNTHPRGEPIEWIYDWCDPKDVTVEYLGEATADYPAGVVCASFNAG